MEKQFKVVDGDNLVLMDTFTEDEREETLKRYQEDGRWEDVDFDADGDLILFKIL